MKYFFREFFGHVEPASSARCKLHLRMHLETEATPGHGKNESFSFLFLFCVCSFYFRASDTHDFVHFFHPHVHAPPRLPIVLLPLWYVCDMFSGLFWFPFFYIIFKIVFPCRLSLAIQKLHIVKVELNLSSLFTNRNFLRASCWCSISYWSSGFSSLSHKTRLKVHVHSNGFGKVHFTLQTHTWNIPFLPLSMWTLACVHFVRRSIDMTTHPFCQLWGWKTHPQVVCRNVHFIHFICKIHHSTHPWCLLYGHKPPVGGEKGLYTSSHQTRKMHSTTARNERKELR